MGRYNVIGDGVMAAYEERLRAEGRLCAQSMIYLSVFDNYCHARWPDACGITQEMVDEWCAPRPTEKANSTRTRVFPVIALLGYMRARGLTDVADPDVPRAEPSTYVPHAFTEGELSRFFAACDSYGEGRRPTAAGRNLALTVPVFYRLLYSSGMRTTEARLLGARDADLAEGVLYVRKSKGADGHVVALHETMADAMRRYDAAIGAMYPGREFFFPVNVRGGRSTFWVWKTFRTIWDSVNESHAVPYELRHHYAVENVNSWAGDGIDSYERLVYLSRSMGHARLESTRRYYSIVPALAEVIERLSGPSLDELFPEVE